MLAEEKTLEEFLPRGMPGRTRITNSLRNHFNTYLETSWSLDYKKAVVRAMGLNFRREPLVRDVCKFSRIELLRAHNFGNRSCSDLEAALAEAGLFLKQEEQKLSKPRLRVWIKKSDFTDRFAPLEAWTENSPDSEMLEFVEVRRAT